MGFLPNLVSKFFAYMIKKYRPIGLMGVILIILIALHIFICILKEGYKNDK